MTLRLQSLCIQLIDTTRLNIGHIALSITLLGLVLVQKVESIRVLLMLIDDGCDSFDIWTHFMDGLVHAI